MNKTSDENKFGYWVGYVKYCDPSTSRDGPESEYVSREYRVVANGLREAEQKIGALFLEDHPHATKAEFYAHNGRVTPCFDGTDDVNFTRQAIPHGLFTRNRSASLSVRARGRRYNMFYWSDTQRL